MLLTSFHQNAFEGKLGFWQNYLSRRVPFPQGASADREGKHLRQTDQKASSHEEKLCCPISLGSPRAAFSLRFPLSGQMSPFWAASLTRHCSSWARGAVQRKLGELFWALHAVGTQRANSAGLNVLLLQCNENAKPLCDSWFLFSPW